MPIRYIKVNNEQKTIDMIANEVTVGQLKQRISSEFNAPVSSIKVRIGYQGHAPNPKYSEDDEHIHFSERFLLISADF